MKHYVIASQSQRRVRGRPLYHGGGGAVIQLPGPLWVKAQQSWRPRLSGSDTWLLTYGRKKGQNEWLLQTLLLLSNDVKMKHSFEEWVLVSY